MATLDSDIQYRYQDWYLPAAQMSGVFSDTGHGLTQGTVAPFGAAGTTTGSLTGMQLAIAGQFLRHTMPVPGRWQLDKAIHLYLYWTSGSATVGDSITWKVLYNAFAEGAVTVRGATALDTAPAAVNPTATAWQVQRTGVGTINANSLAHGGLINFDFELDALTGITEDIVLVGAEFWYLPRLTGSLGTPVAPY